MTHAETKKYHIKKECEYDCEAMWIEHMDGYNEGFTAALEKVAEAYIELDSYDEIFAGALRRKLNEIKKENEKASGLSAD